MPSLVVSWAIAAIALVAALAIALKSRADRTHRQARIAALERLLGDARLDALRTQLHPHFLFNALNAISAHVERDPRTARWMLERLGSLLHMSLEHAREQEMPLGRELDFIACYIDLQKVRFDNRVTLVTDVAPEMMTALVPSLILQPLVENAVRHGLASGSAAGTIEIRARREADTLRVTVKDDGPGLPAGWDPAHGFGVGLSNTRERLDRLYGADQRFDITGQPDEGVLVTLTIPFHVRDEVEAAGAATAAVAARTQTVGDTHGS
jgi:two-component system LytT family sensor kinase